MIKVCIITEDYQFEMELGSFQPKEIKDIVNLIQSNDAILEGERYIFQEGYYNLNSNRFDIIVALPD